MAVSGNESNKIDMTNFSNFKNKNINQLSSIQINEQSVAGVTPEMAANIKAGIDSYITNVTTVKNTLIETINSAVENKRIFQGYSINSALNSFVNSVNEAINSYVNGLAYAEDEIVKNVAAAYLQNDQTMSSNINSVTDTMEGFNGQ